MSGGLPPLKHVRSPNFSSRHGARVDLIVVHDTEGGYAGAVAWFANAHSQVSAHLVLKEDASEATQMVDFADKAWHAVAFNSRSIGVEMAGFAKAGYSDAEWQMAARIVAYLLHLLQIPLRWAKGGVGPGFCSHYDLGAAGGGHRDPTTDPHVWAAFIDRVEAEAKRADWPAMWVSSAPKSQVNAPKPQLDVPKPPDHAHDSRWIQDALNAAGADPKLKVDGKVGPLTEDAIRTFKRAHGLPDTSIVDRDTIEALEGALAPRHPPEPSFKRTLEASGLGDVL